jgi:hypothetical protein
VVLPVNVPSSPAPTVQELAERIRPVALAREAVVPVVEALRPLLADVGLIRGSTLTVGGIGATSLALSLLAGPSQSGSWVAIVGLDDLAPAAVLEAGLDGDRVAFIDPGRSERLADVVAALIGAVDLVVLDARLSITASACRRLTSRCRERGSILVVVSPNRERSTQWPVDRSFITRDAQWEGVGRGHGHLRSRTVRVDASGRGRASRQRQHELLLPAADGGVAVAGAEHEGATVIAFSR